LEFFGASFVATQSFLKRDWLKVKVKSNPGKAKGLLGSELAKKPLASASYYVTFTVGGSKGVAYRPR
jgi:hypothetical protein